MSAVTENQESKRVSNRFLPPGRQPVSVGKKLQLWNRIPQLVNRFLYLLKSNPAQRNDYLDYDPFYLRVFTNQRYSAFGERFHVESLKQDPHLFQRLNSKEMDLETFKLAIEQVPGIRTVEFSGRGEPLLNPELFEMVQHAHQYNGAETVVVTQGILVAKYMSQLLNSTLDQLCIRLHGHKPSTYHQMSGLDAHNFVPIIENIKSLIVRKTAMHSPLKIILSMTVDIHTFRNIPEMIVFAHELGADGVIIENYLPENSQSASERTLYSDQSVVQEFLRAIDSKLSHFQNFEVTLPVLLDRNMKYNRFCTEAYTTVAIDGNCTVYPCSRQLLSEELGETPKIWESDFWNHTSYNRLRNIHSKNAVLEGVDVPVACQLCPRNIATANLNAIKTTPTYS